MKSITFLGVFLSGVILTCARPQVKNTRQVGYSDFNNNNNNRGTFTTTRPGGYSDFNNNRGGYNVPTNRPPFHEGFRGSSGTKCGHREVAPGHFKFTCENVAPPVLQTEHVLWINLEGGQPQLVDIEVPNYKIDELLKAGFKGAIGGNTLVNVLLKRPQVAHNAEVDRVPTQVGIPEVNINYEPVQKLSVHYPNDKPYQTLSGPIQQKAPVGGYANPTPSGGYANSTPRSAS